MVVPISPAKSSPLFAGDQKQSIGQPSPGGFIGQDAPQLRALQQLAVQPAGRPSGGARPSREGGSDAQARGPGLFKSNGFGGKMGNRNVYVLFPSHLLRVQRWYSPAWSQCWPPSARRTNCAFGWGCLQTVWAAAEGSPAMLKQGVG